MEHLPKCTRRDPGNILYRLNGDEKTLMTAIVPDPDIWSAVKVLTRRHGQDAPAYAANRAEECKADGDPEGWAIWVRICSVLNELLRATPSENDHLH